MTSTAHVGDPGQWSAPGKVGFRFLFTYLILCTVPGPIGYLPFGITRMLSTWQFEGMLALSTWTQIHLLRIAAPAPFAFTGSSDTIYRYATYLDYSLIAIIIAALWTLIDR